MGKLIRSSSLKVKVAYDTFFTLYINQFGHFQAIRKISTDRQTDIQKNIVIEAPPRSLKILEIKEINQMGIEMSGQLTGHFN